ncbi:MFS transporter [Pseudogracilibacillus auburnensis]|uniref:MFS transporter n=1 Tax=Pseudogracilibacillus auburnensis TaxID=1494959 RepID=UPI001A95EF8F|nr:MFS transporter [Pseudogracilibacillus auburnensis]MBO1001168.1 MFS transporter [Pseudogracilibacillus auburnensis]
MVKKESLTSLKLLIFHFHATNTIIISFLPLYLKFKGLTGTEIGWVLAIGPFASIISQPFWGYLSDKYKTVKRMLILSTIGMLIISVIFFQMDSLLTILILGALFFFFSSPVGALSDSLAQRQAQQLKISFGSIRMWGSVGFAFSSLVVGEILTKFGIQVIVWPYVIIGTILLIIAFTISDVKSEEESTPVNLADISMLLKNKPFIFFLLFMMFITITHRANDSFIGIYITEVGGSEGLVGIAWFVGVISEAAVFAFAGLWFRKYSPITFVIIASILYCIRWFIYGMAPSPYFIISFQVLHGVTFGIFYIAAFDYVTKLIPNLLQSTGHLIFYSVMFGVSGIIGSMAGGKMIEAFGGQIMYLGMGLFTLLGIFCLLGYQIWMKRLEVKVKTAGT